MKQAIIAGATGLVGKAVARFLISKGIKVLCLGRKRLTLADIESDFGKGVTYIDLAMENICELSQRIEKSNWQTIEDCVFYNFSWSGAQKLTDGDFKAQLNNAIYAANAVKAAKQSGCIKFVNAGSLEETYTEQHLKDKCVPYTYSQTNYAIAKLASRDMCRMVSYLEKIDYVHTRMSVPLRPDLSAGTYIAKTLKKIALGKPYEQPENNQLFDIIFIDDVARAYHLIGLYGKNKADYYIGTSEPITLHDYFRKFNQVVRGLSVDNPKPEEHFDNGIFDIQLLCNDTGFQPLTNRLHLMGNSTLL